MSEHVMRAKSPDLLPVLGRGRHRRPRQGGCFMEIASFLAGERWSDHPGCTHPLLAQLARAVNDCTRDAARPSLAPLIPSVIGLVSDDSAVDVALALHCARLALPVSAAERQEVLAAAVVTTTQLLVDAGRDPRGHERAATAQALALVPLAAASVTCSRGARPMTVTAFARRLAPLVVARAVDGIAQACVPDPDALLRDLLSSSVDVVRAWTDEADEAAVATTGGSRRQPVLVDDDRWAQACAVTGVVAR